MKFYDQIIVQELINIVSVLSPTEFDQALQAHLPRMYSSVKRILQSDDAAQDAVQDACLQAYRNFENFEGRAQIGTWLHRIAINAALARLRKQGRLRETQIDELMPQYDDYGILLGDADWQDVSSEALLARAQSKDAVRRAIDRLPEKMRILLVLRDIEELSTIETAEQLDMTVGSVKTGLHRARFALKGLLEPIFKGGVE